MENLFNNRAERAPKNVYLVCTENLVDSLSAADKLSAIIQSSENQDSKIYFVDMIDVVYIEQGSDESLYAQNIHGYTQADYKKACHIFQKQLEDKYGLESSCVTSTYSGSQQYSIFSMFEQEDADNVVVIMGDGLDEMMRHEIGMARSGPEGMKKHVQFEVVDNCLPDNKTSFRCANRSCPNQITSAECTHK